VPSLDREEPPQLATELTAIRALADITKTRAFHIHAHPTPSGAPHGKIVAVRRYLILM
jgi:hypothetical protein